MIKKIEDWNYYELLSVERTASSEEIWQAYQAALSTYHPGSMASYGIVTEEERAQIMDRVQEAYRTLRDPVTRKEYDLALLKHAPYVPPKASFRRSVGRLEIGEAAQKRGFRAFLRRLHRPRARHAD